MGRYLDTLKKNEISPSAEPKKPNKPQNGGCLGLLGSASSPFEKTEAANDDLKTEAKTTSTAAVMLEMTAPVQIVSAGDADIAPSDPPDDPSDDRRRCTQCLNLQGRACTVAAPGARVSANRGYQPPRDVLQRCAGYAPNDADHDQRPGIKRWPGLNQRGSK